MYVHYALINIVSSLLAYSGASTTDALVELGLADSDRVHTIQRDVETTRARYTAVQQCSADQQRLVNAAFAQLQDPSHNLAVLMNWVRRQHMHCLVTALLVNVSAKPTILTPLAIKSYSKSKSNCRFVWRLI